MEGIGHGPEKWQCIFQRVLDWVFQSEDNIDPYIDDVPIGSSGTTFHEVMVNHEKCLRRALDILAQNQLFVKKRPNSLYNRWNFVVMSSERGKGCLLQESCWH